MKKDSQINTRRRRRLLFFVFLLVGTGIILVAIRTVRVKSSGVPVVHPITVPRYFPGASDPGGKSGYNAKEEAAIESFQKWIDSLQNDPRGKTLYDSIVRLRPGLLDSARNVAHYYFLHNLLK